MNSLKGDTIHTVAKAEGAEVTAHKTAEFQLRDPLHTPGTRGTGEARCPPPARTQELCFITPQGKQNRSN